MCLFKYTLKWTCNRKFIWSCCLWLFSLHLQFPHLVFLAVMKGATVGWMIPFSLPFQTVVSAHMVRWGAQVRVCNIATGVHGLITLVLLVPCALLVILSVSVQPIMTTTMLTLTQRLQMNPSNHFKHPWVMTKVVHVKNRRQAQSQPQVLSQNQSLSRIAKRTVQRNYHAVKTHSRVKV